eukprot:3568861-Rhodomonas_salina.1
MNLTSDFHDECARRTVCHAAQSVWRVNGTERTVTSRGPGGPLADLSRTSDWALRTPRGPFADLSRTSRTSRTYHVKQGLSSTLNIHVEHGLALAGIRQTYL